MKVKFLAVLVLATAAFAQSGDLKRAVELYQHTDYEGSLKVLLADRSPNAAELVLIGKNHYMRGDYKKAVEAFHKADQMEPNVADTSHWLGRSYGRRAETSNPLAAPGLASKARQYFERAVALDPKDVDAMTDLFEYYLEAPGFLGGGYDKASDLAKKIREVNPAEYHYSEAQIAEKRKQYDTAEEQLRRAIALAPRQVGRVIDLAKNLAKQHRYQESDAAFQQADQLAPGSPKVMFAKAHAYIDENRRLNEAKTLLETYLKSNLTPDDPSRQEAQKLLKQVAPGS